MLGDELDKKVKSYIGYLQERGAVVNIAIVLEVAQGVVRNHDGNLLACNGGHNCLGKPWAKNLLSCMGYVKRQGSTLAKITVSNFEELKEQFFNRC